MGIGKTTLLKYGQSQAVSLEHTVLSAEPVESEMPLEYAGLADLLEMIPATLVDTLPGPQQEALRQAVLRVLPSRGPTDPRTTGTALLSLLRRLAASGPVAVVIDDLPWLDAASAEALSFALRRIQHEPVGLLAAVRTEWSSEVPHLATDSVPPDRVAHLRLGPLSLGATGKLLAARTALPAGRSMLVRLHEVSGGNPLFALQLAVTANRAPATGMDDQFDVPESLRRLVLRRIKDLSPRARDVLLVNALGQRQVLPVICAAASAPDTAYADLEEGIRAGLLRQAGDQVAFVHPLMRSVVLEDASPADRRAAHRRLAAVVPGAEARARHLALAAEAPEGGVAAALEKAALIASRRGASGSAADLAELAVALTPLGQAEGRQRRTVLAAEQRFEASDPARACFLLENILDAAPAGPGRGELLRRLARYRAFQGQPLAVWSATLARALEEAGEDAALRAVILLDQAVAASNAGDLARAGKCGGEALQWAERTGDKALQTQCCAGFAFLAFVLGKGVRTDLISRALAGPVQSPRLSMELRPNVAIGHVLHWADDLEGARKLYEQEYTRAVEDGVETGLPLVLWAMAENEGWAGNWGRAEQLATEGYSLAEESGSEVAVAFMSAVRGLLHAYRGRIEDSQRDAARALELAQVLGIPLLTSVAAQSLGIAALSAGDALTAHQRLSPLTDALLSSGVTEPALCRFVPDEVEALTRLGELDAAEALLQPFEARSVQLGRRWGIAAAGRCRGLLRAARGDLTGAEENVTAALEVHGQLGMPFEEARTLLAAGEIHRRARHKHIAAEYLQAALTMFEELGAPQWQARAHREYSRVGLRSAGGAAGPTLTSAEQRVANLAAGGRTTAEIAAELFMGRRTVEAHLFRVYRKLGVRSRTDLCRLLSSPASPATGDEDSTTNVRGLRIRRRTCRSYTLGNHTWEEPACWEAA
jgi:DNA-binding CsgD family transcriptional regulator